MNRDCDHCGASASMEWGGERPNDLTCTICGYKTHDCSAGCDGCDECKRALGVE